MITHALACNMARRYLDSVDPVSSALVRPACFIRLAKRSEYLRRTMVEHYTWLGALSLMMREQQFRVSVGVPVAVCG